MTRIDIISGFLGAGKTTLIKKLLKEALNKEKVVLIENEFGEIGIDGGFLQEAGIEIKEINSGCICCSLVGDFDKALREVVDTYHPDRIIIEPSGVGKLSDVINAVRGIEEADNIVLNSATAVVDANNGKKYMRNFGEFFNNQIESAGSVILSRTQGQDKSKLENLVELIKEHNTSAHIVTTPWEELSADKLLEVIEGRVSLAKDLLENIKAEHHHHHEDEECEHHHHHEDEECECGHHHHEGEECECGHHHHHKADEVFESWGIETANKFEKALLERILQELSRGTEYGIILRAKGMLQQENGAWLLFDLVPEEYEIRDGSADFTGRICVIGSKLDKAKLEKLFKGN